MYICGMWDERVKRTKITIYIFLVKPENRQAKVKQVWKSQLTPLTCSSWNSISSGTVARNINVLYPSF